MAKAKNSESQSDEIEIQPETETAAVKSVAVQTTLVCIAGYNHAAIQTGDILEIHAAGLPSSFSMKDVTEGYFPGEFKKRFNIASHVRDEKTLKLKITPQV